MSKTIKIKLITAKQKTTVTRKQVRKAIEEAVNNTPPKVSPYTQGRLDMQQDIINAFKEQIDNEELTNDYRQGLGCFLDEVCQLK